MKMEVSNIKILAIDQASTVSGYSIWKDKLLASYGKIQSKDKDIIERMYEMYNQIKALIKNQKPDFVVLEGVQYQSNQKTYNQLSQLQGVLFSICLEKNIGFCIVEPSVWRQFSGVKGRVRAEQKLSAIEKIKELYGFDTEEDVAESILIGVWAINNVKKGAG
jgi:Holliday junction resolvasome RuvABC endonuclease subunit